MSTTASIWEKESFYAERDFIIVGAGLAGLWCALEIRNHLPSAAITVLEKAPIPTGASTRNAGFACFGSPTELIADKKILSDSVWETVAMRYKGISKIRKVFGDDIIDYVPCGGYECLTEQQTNLVGENLRWLNEGMRDISGLANCFNLTDHTPADFGFAGFASIVSNPLEGGLHSGKLVQALWQKVVQQGVQVLCGTPVAHLSDRTNGVDVTLENGIVMKAGQVVLCTNAFTGTLAPGVPVTPARGQIIVTAPIPGLVMKGTFHYDEGYYYFRNLGDRILLGGARNQAFEDENNLELNTSATIQNALESFIATHLLPNTSFTIEHRWSGIMGFTKSKMPVIEEVGLNTLAVVACNGMGVALTPMIAEAVAAKF